MDEYVASGSSPVSDERIISLFPVFYAVSSAFIVLSDPEKCRENQLELTNKLHLLGMLIWRVQTHWIESQKNKLDNAEKRVKELRKRRSEEAKANERVVSIVSAREQIWFNERKMLRQRIGALMNEKKSVVELSEKLEECEEKWRKSEEKIREAEILADVLRENADREAQCHSTEILRHKTAIIELVSSQRQLEADLNRTVRQVETAKEEAVMMNKRLSMELVKMHKDLETKDQILSVFLRKPDSDKQIELQKSKTTRKHESMRWKQVQDTKNERHLFKNLLSKHIKGHTHSDQRKGVDSNRIVIEGSDERRRNETHPISDMEEERRHKDEVEAFMEQLRLKGEKIEALQWRLLSAEIETKRLQSYLQGLGHDFTKLRHENMKLETVISDYESELQSLKKQQLHKPDPNPPDEEILNRGTKDIVLAVEYPRTEEGNDVSKHLHFRDRSIDSEDGLGLETRRKFNSSSRKMDIQALGVTYKIKRLKQQALVLERLTGKQECNENENAVKGIYTLMSLLNKQLDRYQSLQGKTDDLCQRMQENNLNLNSGHSGIGRTEEEAKILELFLEETFELQRYIVSTGQKLTDLQAKIASGIEGEEEEKFEKLESFDSKRFADSMRTLLREVQRGLEIRISRIIGDLEGTLAYNGIIHLKK